MAASELNLVVPYPKDGGSDKRMRFVVKYLAAERGADITETNYSGAAFGHEAIARSSSDGRTIGMIPNEVGMMHWLGHSNVESQIYMYTVLAFAYVESTALIVRSDLHLNSVDALLNEIASSRIRSSGRRTMESGNWL